MQGIISKTADTNVKRGDMLPVYIQGDIVCYFIVESFTETQAIGDFTITVEANLQFNISIDGQGQQIIVPIN